MVARSPLRRRLLVVCTVLLVLCLLPFGWIRWTRIEGERQYQAQLALARKDGIPTTPEEFDALIPRAEPHENAALHYKKLEGLKMDFRLSNELKFALVRTPTDEQIKRAQQLLASVRDALADLDAGTDLTKCWFDRDWSRKPRKPMDEASIMEAIADMPTSPFFVARELLPLRGTLRMLKGDAEGAISDAERMFTMAEHYRQEPSVHGQSVGWMLEFRALETLSAWCYARRGDPVYQDALKRSIDRLTPYDPWIMNLRDLSGVAYVLDRCWTKEGRSELGLEEPSLREQLSLAFAPADTKFRIIEGLREMLIAARLPHPERWTPMNDASQKVYEASKPLVGIVNLMSRDYGKTVEEQYIQVLLSRVCFRAVARALEQREIPTTLNTNDLISPITGLPVVYSFDGSVIRVSGGQRHPHRFVVKPSW